MIDPGALQFVGCCGALLWPWLGLVGETFAGDPDIAIPNIRTGLLMGSINGLIAIAGFIWAWT